MMRNLGSGFGISEKLIKIGAKVVQLADGGSGHSNGFDRGDFEEDRSVTGMSGGRLA